MLYQIYEYVSRQNCQANLADFFKLRETAWHFWLLCLGMAGGIWGCFKYFEFTNSWAQYWSFCTGKQTAVNFDICSTFYTLQYTVHFVVHCKLCSTFWNFSVQCKIFPILIAEDCTLCSTLYILQYTVNFTVHCKFYSTLYILRYFSTLYIFNHTVHFTNPCREIF